MDISDGIMVYCACNIPDCDDSDLSDAGMGGCELRPDKPPRSPYARQVEPDTHRRRVRTKLVEHKRQGTRQGRCARVVCVNAPLKHAKSGI
jgi:hypothetical protein